MDLNTQVRLHNGVRMPILGYGTYCVSPGRQAQRAFRAALECGYRHFDTAAFYQNEEAVGEVIRASGLPREELFVTTKLWNSDQGYDSALKAFDLSLKKLGLDQVDLYLVHWPEPGRRLDSWRALTKIYEAGRARAVGVSNYTITHLRELLDHSSLVPVVNQVEFHPFLYQKELLVFCRDHEIQLQSYSPLTKGARLNDPSLVPFTKRYQRSPAQIMIRWCLEHQVVVLPKSANPDRICENAAVFDFSISQEDMTALNGLNEDYHCTWDPTDEP